MKKKKITRRTFIKETSLGAVGVTAVAGGTSALYANVVKNADKPALLGGTPVRNTRLGVSWPVLDRSDEIMYVKALHRRRWSEYQDSESELVTQFERKYAELMGVNYCAATNAGTTALSSALRAVDLSPGDEVILPTNTFIATAQVIFNIFALAVFVDSDPETFMIDANKIEERINENTKVILPVHIGGGAADMDKINEIAKKHNLAVVEDACQAHMGEWRGKKLGTVGDLGCFSFQASKSLACGEGGAVVGNDEPLMARAAAYGNNGRDPMRRIKRPGRVFPGSNYRMTPFQASLVMGQMRRLENQSSIRDENAAHLEKLLADVKGVRPSGKYPGQTRRAYFKYQMIYDKKYFNGLSRDKFREAMRAEGISLSRGIDSQLNRGPFVEKYLSLRGFQNAFSKKRLDKYRKEIDCPVNDYMGTETGLSLNHRNFLGGKKDMEDIVTAMLKVQKNSADLL